MTNFIRIGKFKSLPRIITLSVFAFSILLLTMNNKNRDTVLREQQHIPEDNHNGYTTPIKQLQVLLNRSGVETRDISKLHDVQMLLRNSFVEDNLDYTTFSDKISLHSKSLQSNLSSQLHETEFKPYMAPNDKAILYETLNTLYRVCKSLQFICMMYSGTLLGSWRHHEVIPWDGDADVLANTTEKDELFSALAMLSPSYEIINTGTRFKLYSRKATKTSQYSWKWPYVDIWFFKENNTHIWDEIPSRAFMRDYVYPKSIIFPLHLRPFGPIYFPSPFDSFAALTITYRTTDCETYFYNHKYEITQRENFRSLPCHMLRNQVAFVFRIKAKDSGLVEILVKGKDVLNVLKVNEPRYAITNPFNLTLL